METFNAFYQNAYYDFCRTVDKDSIMPKEPVPYKIDSSIREVARHNNHEIIFRSDKLSNKRGVFSTIHHELVHYYDRSMFENTGYKQEDIDLLCLTFSEIHASYIELLSYFRYNNLSLGCKISLDDKMDIIHSIREWIIHEIDDQKKDISALSFKKAMYILGYRRSLYKLIKEQDEIRKLLDDKQLFTDDTRPYILGIDNTVDFNNYSFIAVNNIRRSKMWVENILKRNMLNNILSALPDEIKKNLPDF